MPATLKLTHKAIGVEVRRGTYDAMVKRWETVRRRGELTKSDILHILGVEKQTAQNVSPAN